MRNEYRIVKDRYYGFEVQIRRWWWPFWKMAGLNTHTSVEKAQDWAIGHAKPPVKYLGRLP